MASIKSYGEVFNCGVPPQCCLVNMLRRTCTCCRLTSAQHLARRRCPRQFSGAWRASLELPRRPCWSLRARIPPTAPQMTLMVISRCLLLVMARITSVEGYQFCLGMRAHAAYQELSAVAQHTTVQPCCPKLVVCPSTVAHVNVIGICQSVHASSSWDVGHTDPEFHMSSTH